MSQSDPTPGTHQGPRNHVYGVCAQCVARAGHVHALCMPQALIWHVRALHMPCAGPCVPRVHPCAHKECGLGRGAGASGQGRAGGGQC